MAGNPNFDDIAATTIDNYRHSLEDNIFEALILLWFLKSKGRKNVLTGGTNIVVPLMYSKNTTVKSYSDYETLDVSPSTGFTAATYPWQQIAGSVTISGKEERVNSGSETQIVNLLDSKVKQLELSMEDVVNEQLFGDGTGNDNKDLLGLQAIVADTPTSGILGGIDRATEVWWRNQYTTATKSSTDFDNLLAAMRSIYRLCSVGTDHPDLGLADGAVLDGYESLLVQNLRLTDTKLGDAGFENLKFKGMVIANDQQLNDTGKIYLLNSKYLNWTVHNAADFLMTNFVRPENQDVKTAQILLQANLVVSNTKKQGIITAIT